TSATPTKPDYVQIIENPREESWTTISMVERIRSTSCRLWDTSRTSTRCLRPFSLDHVLVPLANSPQTGEYLSMIKRNIEQAIHSAIADTPVVLLNGARQTGKTTLARAMAEKTGAEYF